MLDSDHSARVARLQERMIANGLCSEYYHGHGVCGGEIVEAGGVRRCATCYKMPDADTQEIPYTRGSA